MPQSLIACPISQMRMTRPNAFTDPLETLARVDSHVNRDIEPIPLDLSVY